MVDRDVILLKIRQLIAQKEFITAKANYELQRGGWQADWSACQNEIEKELTDLLKEVERGH
jgi:hypothetical protein